MNCAEQSNIIALVNSEWITLAERHRFAADSQNRFVAYRLLPTSRLCGYQSPHRNNNRPKSRMQRCFRSLSEVV
jgi:hypothetical protein